MFKYYQNDEISKIQIMGNSQGKPPSSLNKHLHLNPDLS